MSLSENNAFTDIFQTVSLLSPYLIPLYLLMGSFFNQDLKAFFYIVVLLVNIYLTLITSRMLTLSPGSNSGSNVCKFGPYNGFINLVEKNIGFSSDGNVYRNNNSISINSNIIGFTMAYLLFPMYSSGNINYSIFAIFLALLAINGHAQIANGCSTMFGIVFGCSVGIIFAYILVSLIGNIDDNMKKLLFFSEQEDGKNKCKLDKQKYTCKKVTIKGPVFDELNM